MQLEILNINETKKTCLKNSLDIARFRLENRDSTGSTLAVTGRKLGRAIGWYVGAERTKQTPKEPENPTLET